MKIFAIAEEINVPPHLPAKWFREIKAQAGKIEANLKPSYVLSDASSIEWKELRFSIPETEMFFQRFEEQYFPLVRGIQSKEYPYNISQAINFFEAIRDNRYLQDIIPIDLIPQYKSFKEHYENTARDCVGLEEYEYLHEQGDLGPKEFKIIKSAWYMAKNIYEYVSLALKIRKVLDAYSERQEIRQTRLSGYGGRTKPTHESIETLYHATPFCKEILSSGFKPKSEVQKEILGGHTGDSISFTSDIEIAKSIREALLDVIDIANGDFGLKELFKAARDIRYESLIHEIKHKLRDARRRQVNLSPSDIFDIYKMYLSALEAEAIRYNPVFFSVDIDTFQGLDKNNVGVLAAEVNMESVNEYLTAMEEYRVPVSAILNVTRVV